MNPAETGLEAALYRADLTRPSRAHGDRCLMTRKGICCPKHPTARLRVTHVHRVATGIVRRYRSCTIDGCTYRVPTEERVRPKGGCRKPNNIANA